MLNAIAKPFGILLLWLNDLVGNYGIAIFLFALVVKLILLPFQMKSKKSMMRMSALNPQLQELQKRHEGNPRKLQEETSKLYKEEHVRPMSGCLWSLIPFPILIALYQAIRYPLTVMMRVPSELIASGGTLMNKLTETGFSSAANAAYIQLEESQHISKLWNEVDWTAICDKIRYINYQFLGMNLGDTPRAKFWVGGITWAAVGLFLIPIISALLSWLQTKISQETAPKQPTDEKNPKAQQSEQQMKTMTLMMPLVSLFICYKMPAALGIYWILNSILAIIQELILNKYYGKQIAAESAEREARKKAREAEYERKRLETERLKAEGKTQENTNTSKKKQQARAKAELDELKAAALREERAAKRAALGLSIEEEIPASQVGNRRYARGRAYVPDRFTNPENAAEATAAAAEESSNWSAVNEEVQEHEEFSADVPSVIDAIDNGDIVEFAEEDGETEEVVEESEEYEDSPDNEDEDYEVNS